MASLTKIMASITKMLWFLVKLGKTQTPDHNPRNKQAFPQPLAENINLISYYSPHIYQHICHSGCLSVSQISKLFITLKSSQTSTFSPIYLEGKSMISIFENSDKLLNIVIL